MKFILLFISFFIGFHQCCATEISGWDVVVQKIEAKDSFDSTQDVQIYTGDFIVEENHQKPKAGFCFIDTEIKVNKTKSDAPIFKTNNLQLKVENHYFERYQNDAFLEQYQQKPFPHLNLKQGEHQGSILFEIPKILCNKSKILQYQKINL